MKKNIFYTLCILLSGALFLNSCEDMLEIDRYAIAKLNSVTQKALKAYEDYEAKGKRR